MDEIIEGGEKMKLCFLIVCILLIISVIIALKWKVSALALIWFCKDRSVEPTDEEIADYIRKVVGKMFKLD